MTLRRASGCKKKILNNCYIKLTQSYQITICSIYGIAAEQSTSLILSFSPPISYGHKTKSPSTTISISYIQMYLYDPSTAYKVHCRVGPVSPSTLYNPHGITLSSIPFLLVLECLPRLASFRQPFFPSSRSSKLLMYNRPGLY